MHDWPSLFNRQKPDTCCVATRQPNRHFSFLLRVVISTFVELFLLFYVLALPRDSFMSRCCRQKKEFPIHWFPFRLGGCCATSADVQSIGIWHFINFRDSSSHNLSISLAEKSGQGGWSRGGGGVVIGGNFYTLSKEGMFMASMGAR